MGHYINQELSNLLQDICRGRSCPRCPIVIREPGKPGFGCMSIEIRDGKEKPEYLEQVWKAYNDLFPKKAAQVSDEVRELLGVKPAVQINVTEEDMMNLFSQ